MPDAPPLPSILENELVFTTARSAGPGGQNVNKVETKVILSFDVLGSPSLSPEQKGRVLARLSTRISKAGVLRLSSQRQRSQAANRATVVERFHQLIAEALSEDPERKATRTPKASRERRRAAKRHRSGVKRLRSSGAVEEEP